MQRRVPHRGGHPETSLARLRLAPPEGDDGLPTVLDADEDYSDVFEIVERR